MTNFDFQHLIMKYYDQIHVLMKKFWVDIFSLQIVQFFYWYTFHVMFKKAYSVKISRNFVSSLSFNSKIHQRTFWKASFLVKINWVLYPRTWNSPTSISWFPAPLISCCNRWVSVLEFHDPTLGNGKVFGQESTVVKWNYQILGLHQVTVHPNWASF